MNLKWRINDIRIFLKYHIKDTMIELVSLIKSVFTFILNLLKPTNLVLFFLVWMLVFVGLSIINKDVMLFKLAIFLCLCAVFFFLFLRYQSGEHRGRARLRRDEILREKYRNGF